MKVYSFPRGGISYEDPTVPAANFSVTAFLPALSVIPLVQYPEEKVISLVSAGDLVREGMLIGRGKKTGSVNIHATVPGKVIRNVEWLDHEGRRNEALIIRMEGAFERLGKTEKNFMDGGINQQELLRVLADCGIVEMEGSGKPVAEILSELREAGSPQTLVVR